MVEQSARGFPPPWTVEQIPGGYKVLDANGQSLAYLLWERFGSRVWGVYDPL